MNFVRLIPVFFSFLLISAHFQRAGASIIALICLFSPFLLLITRPWSVRIVQTLLVLSAIEWVKTLVNLAQLRLEYGLPWVRLAIILGAVIFFTLFSTLVFRHRCIQKKYNLQ